MTEGIIHIMINFVKNNMKKVIIIYSPENTEIKDSSNRLAERFDKDLYSVTVKNASGTEIPEIAASDIILFGSMDSEKEIQTKDYKELARALRGISLAGRKAALFSISSEETIDYLRDMIKDTELAVPVKGLLFSKNGKPVKEKNIEKWIDKICL